MNPEEICPRKNECGYKHNCSHAIEHGYSDELCRGFSKCPCRCKDATLSKLYVDEGELVDEIGKLLNVFFDGDFTRINGNLRWRISLADRENLLSQILLTLKAKRAKEIKETVEKERARIEDCGVRIKLSPNEIIEFDDGDIYSQNDKAWYILMHTKTLMPNCEMPDDLMIIPTQALKGKEVKE